MPRVPWSSFKGMLFSPGLRMLFFEVPILQKLRQVSRLSLKLYLRLPKTQEDLFLRSSEGITFFNWFLDIAQFPAMLVGYTGEILVNYLPHAVSALLHHIRTRESLTEKMTVRGTMVRSEVCNSWCYCLES
mgnify:CR=1 FL=1